MSNKAKSITRDFQWICEDIFSRLSLRNLFWELTRFLCVQGQEIIRGLSDVKFAYTWIHFSILNHSSNHLIDQWYCQSHKLYLYFQLELSISSSKEFERILDDFFSFVFLKRSREFGVGRGDEGRHLLAEPSSYKKVHCNVLIGVGDRISNHNDQ